MNRFRLATLSLLLALFAGCGGDAPEPDAVDSPADAPSIDGPDAIADAVGQIFGGEGKAIETVNFRVLRDMLPEDIDEFDRTDISGEKSGMGGFQFSTAEAEYRDEDDSARRIKLQLTDAGGVGRMAMLGAAWMQFEVDKEDSNGYERTTEYEGYPAYEKARTGDRPRAELQIVVADRFFVSAEGENVDMDDLKEAVEELDLDDLEKMRDEGVGDVKE